MKPCVFKYRLDVSGLVEMEVMASPLHVAFQKQGNQENLFVWALVNPALEKCRHRFAIVCTGEDAPDGCTAQNFVGTAHTKDGLFVCHVFDLGPAR